MTRPANFDRVARAYRWCEYIALGPLLQRVRCHWLPQLAQSRRALLLGDGDGRFTEQLLARVSAVEATAVDTSVAMLRLLRKRCMRFGERLQTVQESAMQVQPRKDTDLIVTHFFLDCLTQDEVDALAQRIFAQTPRDALWVVSDFAVPQGLVLGLLARTYIRGLYEAFGVLTGLQVRTLPDVQAALSVAGFERVARHERLRGVLYTEIWRHT